MSKSNRKRRRLISEVSKLGHCTVFEDKNHLALELIEHPGFLLIHRKGDGKQIGMALSAGTLFECKRCNNAHLLRWCDYDHIKSQMQEPGAPPYWNILCVDGEPFLRLAQPGELLHGRVKVINRILNDL